MGSRDDAMARLLVALRGDRSQTQAAAAAGITQSRVSRAERGLPPPFTPAEAQAYARALGGTAAQVRQLAEMAAARTAVHDVPRAVILRNAHVTQERIRDYVADADEILTWASDIIPGECQTEDYTRAMIAGEGGGEPGPEWWAPRRARIALLDDPARRWRTLIGEGALRWPLGSAAVQAAQMRHLIGLSRRPNVEIGVLDFARPKPVTAAYGFHVYGGRAVELPTELGGSFMEHPDDVAALRARHDRLYALALRGDQARALLDRIARDLER